MKSKTGACAGIYKITNAVNGRFYIGSAVHLWRRYRDHRNKLVAGQHRNAKLQRSWNKHGAAAFAFEVVEFVDDKKALIAREQAWIDKLEAVRLGYNIDAVAGSPLGRVLSEATKQKLSLAHTGMSKPFCKWTDERKAEMSKLMTGRAMPRDAVERSRRARIGRFVSEEIKAKMRAAASKKAPPSEETRRKLSEAGKRRTFDDETRAKISAAHKGRVRGPMSPEAKERQSQRMLGKKWTPEEIAKRVESARQNRAAAA